MDNQFHDLIDRLDHVSDQFEELRGLIRKAIRLADNDPEMALTRVRKVLEYVVHDAYQRSVKEPPGTRPLKNLLQRLVKDGHLPPHLAPYTNLIRELGNVGTHHPEGKHKTLDVNVSLIQLRVILDWYFEMMRPDAAALLIVTDPPPASVKPPQQAGSGPRVGQFRDPEPVASVPKRRDIPWRWISVISLPLLAFLGIIVYIGTDKGTVKISGTDPKVPSPTPKSPLPQRGREWTNSIGIKLVLIEAGEFMMGSTGEHVDRLTKLFPDSTREWFDAEQPQHRVRISKPFYLGIHEVTQDQYRVVMGDNPSQFKGSGDLPVDQVSWLDAVTFCNKLSEMENQTPFYRIDGDQCHHRQG